MITYFDVGKVSCAWLDWAKSIADKTLNKENLETLLVTIALHERRPIIPSKRSSWI